MQANILTDDNFGCDKLYGAGDKVPPGNNVQPARAGQQVNFDSPT